MLTRVLSPRRLCSRALVPGRSHQRGPSPPPVPRWALLPQRYVTAPRPTPAVACWERAASLPSRPLLVEGKSPQTGSLCRSTVSPNDRQGERAGLISGPCWARQSSPLPAPNPPRPWTSGDLSGAAALPHLPLRPGHSFSTSVSTCRMASVFHSFSEVDQGFQN